MRPTSVISAAAVVFLVAPISAPPLEPDEFPPSEVNRDLVVKAEAKRFDGGGRSRGSLGADAAIDKAGCNSHSDYDTGFGGSARNDYSGLRSEPVRRPSDAVAAPATAVDASSVSRLEVLLGELDAIDRRAFELALAVLVESTRRRTFAEKTRPMSTRPVKIAAELEQLDPDASARRARQISEAVLDLRYVELGIPIVSLRLGQVMRTSERVAE